MKDPRAIFEHILDAVGNYIRNHSVGIWQEREGEHPFIGSGTCVGIGGRLFIFTAAHNFEDIPKGGTFTLLSDNRSSQTPLTVISYNFGEYGKPNTLDAAWLEVDLASATQADLKGVPLQSIDSHHLLLPNQNYQIAGLPFELNQSYREGAHERFRIPFVMYNTVPSGKTNPNFDLLLDYSEFARTEKGISKMPHPGGISGGGIWYFPLDEGPLIWSADRCRLAGMVTHYLPKSRQIGGLRIHHLLQLLHADIPALHEYIDPLL